MDTKTNKTTRKPKPAQTCLCTQCGESFDRKDVKRAYGEESSVYLLNLCSAQCYTNKVTAK